MLTEYPLQSLLRRSDFTGRITKWGTRLGTYDIWYKLRNSIKGQLLVDFVAEFTPVPGAFAGICRVMVKQWRVYMDNVSNIKGSGVRVIMVSAEGLRLDKSLGLGFYASNNEVEYEALIAKLRTVQKLGDEEVEVLSDSRLVLS